MTNRLIIAAAGSGKTKTLVDEALNIEDENVLITTFTEANEKGIREKILKKTHGVIPANITIQTWFSFLLKHGVRPFQSVLNEDLWDKKIGFYLRSDSSSVYRGKDGQTYSKNQETQFYQYYFTSEDNLKMHSDKVSEFTIKTNSKVDGLVIDRISKIFPHIFIDEVQDLAGCDLEILKELFNKKSNILLVGDPRQGTYSTHNSRKNKKYAKSKIMNFFEDPSIRRDLEIDDTSLTTNYRCNQDVCKVSNIIFPDHAPTRSGQEEVTGHDGVFLLDPESVDEYLEKFPNCVQLRWNASRKVNIDSEVMNFGESKGLEFDRVLIYPTTSIEKWLADNSSELSPITRCKFYVALTRARFSVGIVCKKTTGITIENVQRYGASEVNAYSGRLFPLN